MEHILEILEGIKPEFDFKESKDFIEDGYLDSFDMVELVSTIEDDYEILIDALDIVPENFCSLEAIVKVIRKNGGEV